MGKKFESIITPNKATGFIAADFAFFCPGCCVYHGVWTTNKNDNSAIWQFNGDVEKPTVSPSIRVTWGMGEQPHKICHSFIREGMIQFLDDCYHNLKGQTVELPDIEAV